MRVSANQCRSSGWCTSTGEVVVGRSTPERLTCGTDDGVDQGRLARAGGPADDGEQRGVDGPQARQHVVVELLEELAAGGLGRGAAGHVERQPRPLDGVAQTLDGGDQRLHVPVHRHGASLTTLRRSARHSSGRGG